MTDSPKPNEWHQEAGTDEQERIADALERIADALEAIARKLGRPVE